MTIFRLPVPHDLSSIIRTLADLAETLRALREFLTERDENGKIKAFKVEN